MKVPAATSCRPLLGGPGQDHDLLARQPVQHLREQVVLEAVIERYGRRRADDRERRRTVDPELIQHRLVGLEIRQVVLLLEARITAQLAARAVPVEALRGDRFRDDDRASEPAVDVVLDGRPLVIEGRR